MKVLFETKGPIAYVPINRPSCSTPWTSKPTKSLAEIGTQFREGALLRVGILTGVSDRASCAGSDIKSDYNCPSRRGAAQPALPGAARGQRRHIATSIKDGDRGPGVSPQFLELMSVSEGWIDVSYFPTPQEVSLR